MAALRVDPKFHYKNDTRRAMRLKKLKKFRMHNRFFLQTLFCQKNCERIVSITKEREQVKERTVPVADKKVYFIKIAHYITLRISLHTPNWKDIFTTVKELFVYVDIQGGYTVCQLPLMVSNFTNPPSYSYCFDIVETNERFNSPEGDPRKAFLLEKQLQVQ